MFLELIASRHAHKTMVALNALADLGSSICDFSIGPSIDHLPEHGGLEMSALRICAGRVKPLSAMAGTRFSAVVTLCALSLLPSEQMWSEAVRTGRYDTAADLLQAIVVVDPQQALALNDPDPFHALARLYASGLGVTRDPIAACTLAHMAYNALQQSAPRYGKSSDDLRLFETKAQDGERFIAEQCRGLSDAERLAAMSSLGCYAFGMPEQELIVGGQIVRVGRRGIRLARAPDDSMLDLGCPILFATLRVTTVQPPADAAPGVGTREFIELFTWALRLPVKESKQYLLEWRAHEVLSAAVVQSASEVVARSITWPRGANNAGLAEMVSLQMLASGDVRWRIRGPSAKEGLITMHETRD